MFRLSRREEYREARHIFLWAFLAPQQRPGRMRGLGAFLGAMGWAPEVLRAHRLQLVLFLLGGTPQLRRGDFFNMGSVGFP